MFPQLILVSASLLFGFASAFLAAPSGSCAAAALPVTVALQDGRLLRGLSATDFRIRLNGRLFDNTQVRTDSGPRRILLLLDLNKKLNEDIWRAMVTTAAFLVEQGRPEDRFALLIFGGFRELLDFEVPRSTLQQRLKELLDSRPASPTGQVLVRDGLADALTVFAQPQYGDAILAFFGGEDTDSRLSIERLKGATEKVPVRLFGISFGVLFSGEMIGITVIPGNLFHEMVVNTGGAILVGFNGHPWQTYEFTTEQSERLRTGVWRLYGQIVETYRVEPPLASDGRASKVQVDLSPDLRKQFPGAIIRHRRTVSPCPTG